MIHFTYLNPHSNQQITEGFFFFFPLVSGGSCLQKAHATGLGFFWSVHENTVIEIEPGLMLPPSPSLEYCGLQSHNVGLHLGYQAEPRFKYLQVTAEGKSLHPKVV